MLPFGFLLTQYTITGFDASAHLSEETTAASEGAAKGMWRSIFYSAIGGWIILLAFLFAIQDAAGNPDNAGRSRRCRLHLHLGPRPDLAATILLVSAVGQFFCTTACMTSASRMTFAFSRDRAIPGSSLWSRVNPRTRSRRTPCSSSRSSRALITLPALVEVNIGTRRTR